MRSPSTDSTASFPDHRPWFRTLFHWHGSVLPAVIPRSLFCAGFGLFIAFLHQAGAPVYFQNLVNIVPSIVLGLLLVFRTNTAYERFWEGRKLWGELVNTSRNLARQIWVAVREDTPIDHETKVHQLRLLVAFAIATKQHLRHEPLGMSLTAVATSQELVKLEKMHHPPLEIAFWTSDYLQSCFNQGRLNAYQLAAMLAQVDILVNVLGGCERIEKTPIPLAYAIHLKQLLLLYCLALPFQIVSALGWWTAIAVGLISFAVFGIEAIGIEIENPFGHDANDLPLDTICETMQRNIEDLITLTPDNCRWQDDISPSTTMSSTHS
ncbi:MAG: bestrophin family ion channel [Cyanobacteria bacterium P01_C01_bin.147]